MNLVTYIGATEVFVTTEDQEKYLLATYFNDPRDRNLDEYDRKVYDGVVEITTGIKTDGDY